MNKTARNIGLIALAAGALAYPAYRLYKYLASRRDLALDEGEEHKTKTFAPAYRGSASRAHNRKAEANGHLHS